MPNSYDVGDQVECWARFRDHDTQALVAPATVVFQHRDPDGNITTLTTPDVLISNPSIGYFESAINVDDEGEWFYRWSSTVDYLAAEWGKFIVNDDVFT